MQKFVLSNGLKVLYQKKEGNAAVVQVMVNVGSNDESPKELGISHFLEHILFEGTTSRPTNRLISNEIEKIGGDFNAYTTNERTCFYVKVLRKHYTKALDILSDILQNSLFKPEHIQREINVVLREIDMINDEPRFYQWLLLQRQLYPNHPCGLPTYGSKDVIRNLTHKTIVEYFAKYYVPSNIVISVVGNLGSAKKLLKEIEKKFTLQPRKVHKKPIPKLPKLAKNISKKEKRKIANTYLVIGFPTVPLSHKDAYIFEVINGILGRGQSGRLFTEIRSKHGLAYDVGTQNITEVSFGYLALYASIDRKNISKVSKLMLQEIQKLDSLTEEDLKEAKDFVEGDYLLDLEDSQKVADQLLFWEQVSDAKDIDNYIKRIKKVTINDVKRVLKTYFKKHATIILEGK